MNMPRERDEPVRLTRIYTGGGDRGETSLGDGTRVPKVDCRIAAFGAVDELNSHLGLVLSAELPDGMHEVLTRVQNELFDLGADIATPGEVEGALRIVESQAGRLEHEIDAMNDGLEPLTSFILPGGSAEVAALHLARTVVRRAERAAVALAEAKQVNAQALAYLNRLSDLLFVAARFVAAKQGGDVLWQPGATR